MFVSLPWHTSKFSPPQHAAIEYEINSGARDLGCRAVNVKRVPIADPEVKLPVRIVDTGNRFLRVRAITIFRLLNAQGVSAVFRVQKPEWDIDLQILIATAGLAGPLLRADLFLRWARSNQWPRVT